MAKGRESTSGFRVGKYVVKQVPLNVYVCELRLVATGKNAGMEIEDTKTKTYHKNWEGALNNLFDRLMADKCAESTKDSFNSVRQAIQKAREDIVQELQKVDFIEINYKD